MPTESPSSPRYSMTTRVVITASSGIGVFLTTSLLKLEIHYQMMTSLFVAGVVFVVMYLIEVDHRLTTVESGQQEHSAAIMNRLEDGFLTFNWAIQNFSQLAGNRHNLDHLAGLVENASLLQPYPKLVHAFAHKEIERLGQLMHDLNHSNESVYEGEDRDWMLDLTSVAEQSICAVSLTTVDLGVDGGLWLTDLGQRYLQRQVEAIARGVNIRRVFVTENHEGLASAKLLQICEMHHRLGVKVRTLDVNAAPGILANTMFDFIVFDNAISYESVPASQRTTQPQPIIILTTRLIRDGVKVKDRIDRFEQLWEAATEITG